MTEMIKPTILDKMKSPFKAVGKIFEVRDGEEERASRRARLQEGMDAVGHKPLDEIYEDLGLNDVPYQDRQGALYPSRNEQRRQHLLHERNLDKMVLRDAPVTVFERVKGRFRQKAHNE